MDIEQNIDAEAYRPSFKGFLKIWKVDKASGQKSLVVDKNNLILAQGAGLLASLLSGTLSSGISHMYVGFNNNSSFTPPTIDTAYSVPFSGFTSPFGYLRVPLAFPASFLSDTNYVSNTVIFTSMVSAASSFGGATFTSGTSNIYECALVATPGASSQTDVVFSRVNFNQIQYDASSVLTISWGVKFLVS